jgi:hypothetical protein
VVELRRYLFVLDMDLLALDEQYDLEPINYLVDQLQRSWGQRLIVFRQGPGGDR